MLNMCDNQARVDICVFAFWFVTASSSWPCTSSSLPTLLEIAPNEVIYSVSMDKPPFAVRQTMTTLSGKHTQHAQAQTRVCMR